MCSWELERQKESVALGSERLELSEIPAFLLSPSSARCEGLQGRGSEEGRRAECPQGPSPELPKAPSLSHPSPSPSPDVINKAPSCGPGYRIAPL